MSAQLQFNKKQFPILCQQLHQVKTRKESSIQPTSSSPKKDSVEASGKENQVGECLSISTFMVVPLILIFDLSYRFCVILLLVY